MAPQRGRGRSLVTGEGSSEGRGGGERLEGRWCVVGMLERVWRGARVLEGGWGVSGGALGCWRSSGEGLEGR